jgi:hypothetical protein
MRWEFLYQEKQGYLEITVVGDLSLEELNKMAVERWQHLKRYNCNKFLVDFMGTSKMISISDIYGRPDDSEKIGGQRINRAAAVVPDIYLKEFKFLETVYRNRGFAISIFNSRDEAIHYLNNSTE